MFVAFYALIFDLFAAPADAQFYTLLVGPVSLLGGPGPTRGPVILTLDSLSVVVVDAAACLLLEYGSHSPSPYFTSISSLGTISPLQNHTDSTK